MEKFALIYHSSDVDGLTGGVLLSLKYEKEIGKGNAELFGYNYGETGEWMNDDSFNRFIFVDITPPIEWLKKLEISKSVVIYDHHLNKFEEIIKIGLKNITYYFDNNDCGSKIFYDVELKNLNYYNDIFSTFIKLKDLYYKIRYVDYYDTWKFSKFDIQLKNYTLAFNLFMKTKIVDFGLFKNVFCYKNLDSIIENGLILLENEKLNAKKLVSSLGFPIDSKLVLFNKYPDYFIEEELINKYPYLENWIGFEIKFKDNKKLFSFNVRGNNNKSVKITEYFGGGGHSNAAGFTLNLKDGIEYLENPILLENILNLKN